MEGDQTLSITLPDGIGVVYIRTGLTSSLTGFPKVEVEVVSDAIDIPAQDGHMYEPRHALSQDMIMLLGRPSSEGDGE
jgi:hypothetical protein